MGCSINTPLPHVLLSMIWKTLPSAADTTGSPIVPATEAPKSIPLCLLSPPLSLPQGDVTLTSWRIGLVHPSSGSWFCGVLKPSNFLSSLSASFTLSGTCSKSSGAFSPSLLKFSKLGRRTSWPENEVLQSPVESIWLDSLKIIKAISSASYPIGSLFLFTLKI